MINFFSSFVFIKFRYFFKKTIINNIVQLILKIQQKINKLN